MRRAIRWLVLAGLLLATTPALAAKKPLGAGERIDLNRAGVTELMRLPGVGEKRAQAIVAARSKAPFKKVEDVLVVKGIGPSWLNKVRASVVVASPPASAPASAQASR
ncbi:MAG: helix-hairpin-helix domain-containing protein [Anaeromyxobacter sp.]